MPDRTAAAELGRNDRIEIGTMRRYQQMWLDEATQARDIWSTASTGRLRG